MADPEMNQLDEDRLIKTIHHKYEQISVVIQMITRDSPVKLSSIPC
jgi:hypothetical protein